MTIIIQMDTISNCLGPYIPTVLSGGHVYDIKGLKIWTCPSSELPNSAC